MPSKIDRDKLSPRSLKSIQGMIARAVAYEVFSLPHKCEKCGKVGRVEVHHKNKNRDDNSLENLMILCRACHNKAHSFCESKCLNSREIIREYSKPSATLKSVGERFGVAASCIREHLEDAGYPRKKQGPYRSLK